MNKALIILTMVLTASSTAIAQLKHDFIWTIGYHKIFPIPSGGSFGGIIMDFNMPTPNFTLQDYIFSRPKATISDKNGQLVLHPVNTL